MAVSGFKDLREFIAYVEKRGMLRRISVPVNREYEIAEITSRATRLPGGGPALLFEKVRDASGLLPVVTNLLGSTQRLAWSLGLNRLSELEQRMVELLNPVGPGDLGLGERLARLGETSALARFAPRTVRSAPCQEVVHSGPDGLDELPMLTAWPGEAGPSLRSVVVFSVANKDSSPSITNGQLLRVGAETYLSGLELKVGESRPVALVIGGDPALSFAIRAPFLPALDPLLLAGSLARQRLNLVPCQTNGLEVPATAEIVLEGVIEGVTASPTLRLGQINGFYAPLPNLTRFKLTALTRRKNALFISPVIGQPPHEELTLVKGSERLLLPVLKTVAPEIVDMSLPTEGAFYNLAIVAINKSYAGQAQRVMYSLWGQPQFRFLKHILVVDKDCDIHQPALLAARLLGLLDPASDLITVKGPLDRYDQASPTPGLGHKLGLDATRKLPGEGGASFASEGRQTPLQSLDELQKLVDKKWLDYGID